MNDPRGFQLATLSVSVLLETDGVQSQAAMVTVASNVDELSFWQQIIAEMMVRQRVDSELAQAQSAASAAQAEG